ncbi:hypothetical protein LCGC14_2176440 [marine sediment metagenome]|uniref:Uncharacterized protein n=1 Tax=marine sediment metagenome TaxID=412755 RepID=A0A0F9G191_9ZZZZ
MNRLKWRDVEWWYINLASRPDRDLHAKEQFGVNMLMTARRCQTSPVCASGMSPGFRAMP